ncbi:MAG: PIN domain-containing protein [Thermoplasmatales archaeon]|nr:PIN domain-containing protein [Thermoplasmatales archaeon]
MFLIDTNIFLEIMLQQEKKEKCKRFLRENIGKLKISDFSLHSIGVILFKLGKLDYFGKFIEDILPNIDLLALDIDLYKNLPKIVEEMNLDFDDSYHYLLAKSNKLKIVTMDSDFEKIKDVEIIFL